MKLSTKIFLPIILISALLILLAGCFSVPTDESPGYTPGTITGIIASPCCSTSAEPVSETCCIAPEYWCFYCQNAWSLQDGIEVVLTYGEDEVATTTTNDKGEFTFTDVSPGKNYVVTAYCPDFDDNRPLVKDVAFELLEGGSFDTKITDLVSTSLGLVVDFLVLYTELGPEDIILEGVIADKPNFPNFPKFKKLVYEVRRVLENCEVNMMTDDDLQDALCRASEEVGRETDPDLVIGCGPGYTPPPPPPPPGACDGNLSAIIDSVSIDGDPVDINDVVNVILGESYDIEITAHDQDTKLGTLTYYASVDGVESAATTSNQVTVTPTIPGTFEVFAFAHDGCAETKWGPVKVDVNCCPLDPELDIDISIQAKRSSLSPLCLDECATINSVTIQYSGTDPLPDLVITDFFNDTLLHWDIPDDIDFTKTTDGATVCLTDGLNGTPGTYSITVTYTDPCDVTASGSVDVTFKDCSCVPPIAVADGPYAETVCPGTAATIAFDSTVTSGTSPFTYAWTFGDGDTSNDADPSHEYPTGAKVYDVTLVVTNDCGDSTYNTTVTITEYDGPTADAGGDQDVKTCPCPNNTVTVDFSGSVSGTGTLNYEWDFGDGSDVVTDTLIPSHTYKYKCPFDNPSYTVTLTVTDDNGCTDTDTMTVTITEVKPPTADAGLDRCIQLGCESEILVSFDGSGSSGTDLTYDWDFDDSTSGTGSNPSHTYPAGTYYVTLTVTDSCDNSDTDTMVLTIHSSCGNLPDQLTISYSQIASNYYLNVEFSDGGGDILADYIYHGWCAHRGLEGIPKPPDAMYAYCTLELDKYWDKINYIINNRDGYSRMAVQWAIWHYIHNIDPGSSYPWVNSKAWELINDADTNGIGFCPGIDEKYVVLLTHNPVEDYGDLYKCPPHEQNILIEVNWVDHCLPQDF
jgi:PKD repeat protein